MLSFFTIVALFSATAVLAVSDNDQALYVTQRTSSRCSEQCLPAFQSLYDCLQGIFDNQCILKSCGSPNDHPWTTCTRNPDAPTPSPTPSSCAVVAKDHFPEEFGVQCKCPRQGLTSIFVSTPLDINYCMRACYMMSDQYRKACDEYDRGSSNGSTSRITPVFVSVGRACCVNKCGGVFKRYDRHGKPSCRRA